MAAYVKFQNFIIDVLAGVHDGLGAGDADTAKIYLSNAAPNVATHTVKADVAEIGAGNGYTAGGADTTNTYSFATGTITITGTKVVWTAAGGSIGAFRYIVLYNDSPVAPADPLIAYWDYGAAITLLDGETLTVKFNGGATTGTLFTAA